MLLLILKSSACLAVFMTFYKLFLEKESIHHFKRFYLLGTLLISIVIPFITFTQYIEVEPTKDLGAFQSLEFTTTEPLIFKEPKTWQEYMPTILWSIYGIGVLLFSIRFILNLKTIFSRIKNNPKHQYHEFINVLLNDLVSPHTFFKYIFLNKNKYEHNLIPNEVLLHEQTHAKQKHAFDILCIEVLQIIFWFNPLLYFLKKDIRLNHEFLADQAVLQKGVDSTTYKQTLLAFSSEANEPTLTNAINYSLIKKRFTVMKSKTSKQAFWLKGLLILPILAILIYGFSEKEIIKLEPYTTQNEDLVKISPETTESNHKHYRFTTFLDKDGFVLLSNGWHAISNLKKSFSKLHNKEKADSTEIELLIHKESSESNNALAIDILNSFGTLKTKQVNKLGWNTNYKKPNIQKEATPKQIAEYNKLAKHIKKQIKNKGIVKHKQVVRLKHLYGLMSKSQKEKAESYPDLSLLPPPPPPAKPAEPVKIKVIKTSDPEPKPSKVIEVVEVPATEPTPVEIIEVVEVPSPKPAPNAKKLIEVVEEPSPKIIEVVETPIPVAQKNSIADNQTIDLTPINTNSPWKVSVALNTFEISSMALNNQKKSQNKASNQQVNEYNTIVNKFNALPENKKVVKVTDYKRLLELYTLMSDKQKNITEALPSFITPPKSEEDIIIDVIKNGATCYVNNKKVTPKKAITLINEKTELNISSKNENGNTILKMYTKN